MCIECSKLKFQNSYSRTKYRNRKYQWILRNKEKTNAHRIVGSLIKSGRILKKPCVICEATTVHAHHIDYEYPTKIIWLCPKHHKMAHFK